MPSSFLLLCFFCLLEVASGRVVRSPPDSSISTCFDRSGEDVCVWYRTSGFCEEKSVERWIREGCERTCGFCV
ncbi:hypothetical protein QR680_017246 [Steinernema hermaphroditum]|uniref:ShKT domain-containing protein n=1 Tax=Steinernema hermaphroditum TaxID=289476 RepID=A0AA39HFV8_9BILA|nr:hypothetical protein QR680_017246 [Steinernema hermaphroditum]